MINVTVGNIPKVNIELASNDKINISPDGNRVVINGDLDIYSLLICDGGDSSGYPHSEGEGFYVQ